MNTPDRLHPESSAARCVSLAVENELLIDSFVPRNRSLLQFMWQMNLYDSPLERRLVLDYKDQKMIFKNLCYQCLQLSSLIHPTQPRCKLHARLAAARRRWTLCLFSGSHAYSEWMPRGPFVVTVGRALPCSPCELGTERCPNNVACMTELPPSEVFWRFDHARNSAPAIDSNNDLQPDRAE